MTTEFSKRLDLLLETIGWTKAELASKSGISRQTISRWSGSKRRPNASSIDKIADVAGASKEWLLTGAGQMFAGCVEDKERTLVKLIETWDKLSDKQKRKIMIIAELLPPEVEESRPSPPYRKNLCDWILLNAAKYAGLENISNPSMPPALREYIRAGICDGRCFWQCVAFYSEELQEEITSLLE